MITVKLVDGTYINIRSNKLDKLMTEIENISGVKNAGHLGTLYPASLTLFKFTPFLKCIGIHNFVNWIEGDNITINLAALGRTAKFHSADLIYISLNKYDLTENEDYWAETYTIRVIETNCVD